jgi:hypothetical protein
MSLNTAIITLAVRDDRYRKCADFLEQTIKEHNPEYDFFVYSDCPRRLERRENYYDIKEVTDMKLTSVSVNVFNFNLKPVIFNYFYNKHTAYEKVVFLDADAFFSKKNIFIKEHTKELDFYFINHNNYTYKALGGTQKDKFEKLITKLELDKSYFEKPLRRGIETVFIVNRSNKVKRFLESWVDISKKAIEANILAPYEFMELSIALDMHPDITFGNLSLATTKKDTSIKLVHKNNVIDLIGR